MHCSLYLQAGPRCWNDDPVKQDMKQVHKVQGQFNGPHNKSFAQRLVLSQTGLLYVKRALTTLTKQPWVCTRHMSSKTDVRHSSLLARAASTWKRNSVTVGSPGKTLNIHTKNSSSRWLCSNELAVTTGAPCPLRHETSLFLEKMERKFTRMKRTTGFPFKWPRPLLPNKSVQAFSRLNFLRRTLTRITERKQQISSFIDDCWKWTCWNCTTYRWYTGTAIFALFLGSSSP